MSSLPSLSTCLFKKQVVCFWLCCVFVAVWPFSGCGEQRLLSLLVPGLFIEVASLVQKHRPRARGLH